MEFSAIFKKFDLQEEEKLKVKRELERELDENKLTFYEKILDFLRLSPFTMSLLFGLFLFFLHLTASLIDSGGGANNIIEDFSFLLSILNGVGLYLIFIATSQLKEFLINLIQLTINENIPRDNSLFLKIYEKHFLGFRTFLLAFFLAIINCGIAYVFGIAYIENNRIFLSITFLLQVFLIGFIGGITVSGTGVILKLIKTISFKGNINLLYFYPDKCAGTLVIGNILFLFSLHFIVIGLLIFVFITLYPWTSINDNYYIKALALFWKLFPFLLSGIIFFFPVRRINSILREYKLFEQLRIRKRIHYLNSLIMSFEPNQEDSREKMETLDSHLQKLMQIDHQIGELNTWPYNLKYRATFLSIFLPVLIGMILQITSQVFTKLIN